MFSGSLISIQFRTKDFRDIPTFQFSNSETLIIDQIYLVITKDQKRYGLVRPVPAFHKCSSGR